MHVTIWTIGHSNHPLDRFLELLAANSIQLIADVRQFPASRKHPHFHGDQLAASLATVRIGYQHFPQLGGRRSKRLPDSPNTAWRVEAFNAYADHLQSAEAVAAMINLKQLAESQAVAIMCAEGLPWQCHRRIIADALLAEGWRVLDIMPDGKAKEHALPEFARMQNGIVTYPAETLF